MKKLILPIIACCLFFGTTVSAQVFKIGPKAGIGATVQNIQAATSDGSALVDKFEQADISTHFGAFARITALGFFVQPEASISSLRDLDIPVMLGMKLGPARVMAGPYVRMAFDREAITNSDIRMTMGESARYGYQAGLGLDLGKRIVVDLRYEGSFAGNSATVLGADRPFDTGDPQILLSVGYNLVGGSK